MSLQVPLSSAIIGQNGQHHAEVQSLNRLTGQDNNMTLSCWTPHTTRVLRANANDGHPTGAYDILDHVIPLSRWRELFDELEATGLWQRIRPARTRGEAKLGDLASILQQHGNLVSTNEAAVRLQRSQLDAGIVRGDRITFLSREMRQHSAFPSKCLNLHRLVSQIEATALHFLHHDIEFDMCQTSVQLAEYPGDTRAGYPRHCDCETCDADGDGGSSGTKTTSKRILTFVFYLTDDDWQVEDGGALRVYPDVYDIVPYPNRMVVLRSDKVEHEVLPSRRRRRALTVWLYGRIKRRIRPRQVASLATCLLQNAKELPPPLPCPEAKKTGDDEHATVFVSIAAHRDSETGPTLRNLMDMAQNPLRVFVGLVLQLDRDEPYDQNQVWLKIPTDEPWYRKNVRCVEVQAKDATGPCWARALAQSLYRDEKFVLQIDSHMRFRRNWDVFLIRQLSSCRSAKPMLTTYPIGYELPNRVPEEIRPTLLVPWRFESDGLFRQQGRLLSSIAPEPLPTRLYAAGFCFAPGAVVRECPYDGTLHHLFFGEEISMAIRLYMAGYDLFAPTEAVCYHLWSRAHRPAPVGLAHGPTAAVQRALSIQRVLAQISGEFFAQNGGSLHSQRRVQDFGADVGVDFENQKLSPTAHSGGLDESAFDGTMLSDVLTMRLGQHVMDNKVKDMIARFLR